MKLLLLGATGPTGRQVVAQGWLCAPGSRP